jgi:ribonucleoside-diphosphate reductase alpha chain
MSFIHEESVKASQKLAEERGVFPNWKGSVWGEKGIDMRNATINTIAPTGSISIITGCSSGVEPLFAVSYVRRIMDGMELIEMNPHFERMARERGFYDENLIKKITKRGTIQHIDEIPEDIRRVFVTAHDIQPEWHVRMQAAFQRHTDNAVSKTINFPADATIDDVRKAYMLCYELGCKGITVYRDRSREKQVLNIEEMTTKSAEGSDPAFSASSEYAGGCTTCTI